jgi:acyl-CoA thioester hydrolase
VNDFQFHHRSQLRVRYADTDKMGVVYNGNYLTYFEVGRTELLRAMGIPYAEMEKSGYLLPVLEAGIVYKAPALYDDLLSIETTFTMERGILLRLSYRIIRDNSLIAEGFTKHSFISADTRRPVRPPKFFIDTLQQLPALGNSAV